jgi:hypothetical protein
MGIVKDLCVFAKDIETIYAWELKWMISTIIALFAMMLLYDF